MNSDPIGKSIQTRIDELGGKSYNRNMTTTGPLPCAGTAEGPSDPNLNSPNAGTPRQHHSRYNLDSLINKLGASAEATAYKSNDLAKLRQGLIELRDALPAKMGYEAEEALSRLLTGNLM
jgi:hypothetical protein